MVWGVAGLVHAISDALNARFAACTVRGELSGVTRAASGHLYFTLKDAEGESASLRCAMFRRAAGLLAFQPAEGLHVELRGRVAVYEPRGELQFIAESMQSAGAGAWFERFLVLKQKLLAEGLFDASRKRPLPAYPRRVGVVTSLEAAALHDVLSSLRRRSPHVEVIVYPSLVQGRDAPAALQAAIELAGERREVEVLIVCRGGGSIEDLWAFNDERVVRAIAAAPLPVICGVGHETDTTLSDFAADVRAPTPTAAAEISTPESARCLADLAQACADMGRSVQRALDAGWQRIDRLSTRSLRPAEALGRQHQALRLQSMRLQSCVARLMAARMQGLELLDLRRARAMPDALARQDLRLQRLEATLRGLDPALVLSRGYAWLSDEAGTPLTSVSQLSRGQPVCAVLADGEAAVRIESVLERRL